MSQPSLAIATITPQLVFDDEFKAFIASPDGSKGWMTRYPYGGKAARTLTGNHEAQYYSDSSVGRSPFTLAQGMLGITATPAAAGSNPYGLPYTSGLVTTYKSFAMTYGIFAVRAELPTGQGLWPAFWMLPASNLYTSELDIFEQLGRDPSTIYSSTHGSTGGVWSTNFQTLHVANTATAFHVYAVDWEPKNTTFLMDGKVVATAPTPASMNQPMYMLLNLAVGGVGSWPGSPAAGSIPATMKIDWVRAWASASSQSITGTAALATPTALPLPTTAMAATDWSVANTAPGLVGQAPVGAVSSATGLVMSSASSLVLPDGHNWVHMYDGSSFGPHHSH